MKTFGLVVALAAASAWAQQDGGTEAAVPGQSVPAQTMVTPETNIGTTGSESAAVPVGAPEVPQPIVDANAPWYTRFTPYGYLKVGAFYNFPPLTDQTVNSNDGFRLAALRLGTTFRPTERLTVVASIEAAAPQQIPSAVPEGARLVQMRDAYAEYEVCPGLLVRAGQFKAPVWAETLLDDHMLPFVYRSAIADGYGAPDYNSARPGLSLDRQVGLMVSSQWLGKPKIAEVRYAVAIVNGNGFDQFLNDNNHVAPVARVELRLFEHVALGANGYYNQVTTGARPYRITDNQLAYGGDITATALGFSAMVAYLGRQSSYQSNALPHDSASGILGQLHYGHEGTGLEGAVRFTVYDPSHADPTDDITEFSAMLAWRMRKVPLRVMVEYTHREEAQGVSIPNDGLDAMLQITW